jgi:hypothetical protein
VLKRARTCTNSRASADEHAGTGSSGSCFGPHQHNGTRSNSGAGRDGDACTGRRG